MMRCALERPLHLFVPVFACSVGIPGEAFFKEIGAARKEDAGGDGGMPCPGRGEAGHIGEPVKMNKERERGLRIDSFGDDLNEFQLPGAQMTVERAVGAS